MSTAKRGTVYLVGAGPGDPELLTVKAHRLLQSADLVLHDGLVPAAIVSLAGPRAMVVNVGKRCGVKKITQAEINRMMIASARRGKSVVRLKSGDPGIFGRLGEELDALDAARVPFEVVPGITAGVGAAAGLGVSLTDRQKSSRLVIVSGHHALENERGEKTDWTGLARENTTLVVYMPGRELGNLSRELMEAGLSPATPSVVVSRASTPDQQAVVTTLGELASLPAVEAPAVILIGRAVERASVRASAGVTPRAADAEWKSLLESIGLKTSSITLNNNSERRIVP